MYVFMFGMSFAVLFFLLIVDWWAEDNALLSWRTIQVASGPVASVAALVAAVYAGEAYRQTEIQASAAVETNRPWLKVQLGSGPFTSYPFDLTWRDYMTSFSPALTITNIGHDAAVDINHIYHSQVTGVVSTERQACDYVAAGSGYHTNVLFPNDTINERRGGPGYRGVSAAPRSQTASFPLIIVGCVSYRYAGSDTTHTTSFTYQIWRRLSAQNITSEFEPGVSTDPANIIAYEAEQSGEIVN